MSRGEDIPQDVWDAAMSVATSVRPDMNGLAVVLGSECFDALLTNIARAIMAETERCAKVAESEVWPVTFKIGATEEERSPILFAAKMAAEYAASAIRAGR